MQRSMSEQAVRFIDDTAMMTEQSSALDARAGCGKTTALAKLVPKLKGKVLATSYSRATTNELAARMKDASRVEVAGIHQMGFRALRVKMPRVNLVKPAADSDLHERSMHMVGGNYEQARDLRRLVELGQLMGWAPGMPRALSVATEDDWIGLAVDHQIEVYSEAMPEHANGILHWLNDRAFKSREPVINFSHMLSAPVLLGLRLPQYNHVIVDEAQDLSPLQHRLIYRMRSRAGRFIMAGDPYQAIYAFAGAMHDSYERLREGTGAVDYPLTVSWRCSRAVVEYAKRLVGEFDAAPNAPEGYVEAPRQLRFSEIPEAVLCRNNAPLIRLAMNLFVRGQQVLIKGRDTGQRLEALADKLAKGRKALSSARLADLLDEEEMRIKTDNSKRAPRYMLDYIEALRAMCAHHGTVGEIQGHIRAMFSLGSKEGFIPPGAITLSTIHKAKGLEWDDVMILDPHRLNAVDESASGPLVRQERNLAYVGFTRARNGLLLVDERGLY